MSGDYDKSVWFSTSNKYRSIAKSFVTLSILEDRQHENGSDLYPPTNRQDITDLNEKVGSWTWKPVCQCATETRVVITWKGTWHPTEGGSMKEYPPFLGTPGVYEIQVTEVERDNFPSIWVNFKVFNNPMLEGREHRVRSYRQIDVMEGDVLTLKIGAKVSECRGGPRYLTTVDFVRGVPTPPTKEVVDP